MLIADSPKFPNLAVISQSVHAVQMRIIPSQSTAFPTSPLCRLGGGQAFAIDPSSFPRDVVFMDVIPQTCSLPPPMRWVAARGHLEHVAGRLDNRLSGYTSSRALEARRIFCFALGSLTPSRFERRATMYDRELEV